MNCIEADTGAYLDRGKACLLDNYYDTTTN